MILHMPSKVRSLTFSKQSPAGVAGGGGFKVQILYCLFYIVHGVVYNKDRHIQNNAGQEKQTAQRLKHNLAIWWWEPATPASGGDGTGGQ